MKGKRMDLNDNPPHPADLPLNCGSDQPQTDFQLRTDDCNDPGYLQSLANDLEYGGAPKPLDQEGAGEFAGVSEDLRGAIEPPSEVVRADDVLWCASRDQNDTGNGERLLRLFADQLLNVREAESIRTAGWHRWTGTHWTAEAGVQQATLLAQRTAVSIRLEADHLAATPDEKLGLDDARIADLRRSKVI